MQVSKPSPTASRKGTAALLARLALAGSVALAACGGDDGNGAGDETAPETPTSGETASEQASDGGEGCSLVDVATVEELFQLEVTTVDEPAPGSCFFLSDAYPEIPNAGVTVRRNELGAPLYEEFAAEIGSFATGSGGSGLVEVDLGDEAIGHPGPNAADVAARRGDVNVRVTAEVPSETTLSQDELLAAATELAGSVL
jgi:hypothetical protein